MWVVGTLVMAALVTPWVYLAGKQLAAAAEAKHLPALLNWLGDVCGRSRFPRYFDRCLLVSALVLLPLLLKRITRLRSAAGAGWLGFGASVPWRCAVAQMAIGCVIAAGVLWGAGAVLEMAGAFAPKSHVHSFGSLLQKVFIPAAAASLLEEWLFRGLLLGLWLRFSKTVPACIGTSVLFAFLHFLKPPDGMLSHDPTHFLAGFELLGKILLHFANPQFFVTDFAMLLAAGLVLAWARVRTGALWFSIGLHAGWIMAFKGFNRYHENVPGHFLHPWGVGDNLLTGVLPMVTLALTAVICHFALRRFDKYGRAVSPASP